MSNTITIDNIKYTPSIIQRMEREAARMYAQDQKHQMQIARLEGEKRTLAARLATLEAERAALVTAMELVRSWYTEEDFPKKYPQIKTGWDVWKFCDAALAAVRGDPAHKG